MSNPIEFMNNLDFFIDKIIKMFSLQRVDAEDVVMTSYVNLLTKKNLYKIQNIDGYFFRMVLNTTYSHLNRVKQQNKIIVDTDVAMVEVESEDINDEDEEELQNKINEFTSNANAREILSLYLVDMWTYREICSITGFAYDNVRQIVSRFRRWMKYHDAFNLY